MEGGSIDLDKTSAQPLYLQLEDLLRSWIESGRLKPGDRVPSELELAQMYSISRMTARRAIDTLVMEGILFRRHGKGTFVAPAKMAYTPATLFSFSTAMQALGLSVTTKILDLRLVPAPESVIRDLQLPDQQEVILVKRLRYIENLPMALHTTYMPSIFAGVLAKDLTSRPMNEVMEEVSGLRLVASRDYVEASLARTEEATLLGIHKGAPVLLVRGIVYSAEGLPARVTKAVYRGDHFRFFITAGGVATLEVRLPNRTQMIVNPTDEWFGPVSINQEDSVTATAREITDSSRVDWG